MRSRWLWILFGVTLSTACSLGPGPQKPVPGYLVYVHDREGTVLAAIDDNGKMVSKSADDGFGLRLSSTGTPVPRDFLDQDLDEETGYLHFRHRYYDPATAQWISPDPRLLTDPDCSASVPGCNPYAFAGNRPLEWIDLDGRSYERMVDSHGVVTLIYTLGFAGPDAAVARQLFVNSIGSGTGEVKVIALTGVYKSEAEIPSGFSHVVADQRMADKGDTRSTFTAQKTSRVTLGQDAIRADNDGQSRDLRGTVIDHELLHLAGLDDGYSVGATQHSLPGHENGYMGQFYLDAYHGTIRLTPLELKQLASPPTPVNQGLNQSPGVGPDSSADLQMTNGHM